MGVDLKAFAERVFRHGFSDGWRCNQNGRESAPAAVDIEWGFYVKNEALRKSIEAHTCEQPVDRENARLREALRRLQRTGEMSAGIMRDRHRTGGWEGAGRTADAFDRMSRTAAAALEEETK